MGTSRSVTSRAAAGALRVLLLAVAACCSGCSLLKASEAPDAGFLEHPELLQDSRDTAPFHKSWIYDREDFAKKKASYTRLVVRPVNTSIIERRIREELQTEKGITTR